MKHEVLEELFYARIIYYSLHAIILGVCIFLDGPLHQMITSGQYFWPTFLLANFCIANYFFHTTGRNPGYISFDTDAAKNHNGIE